MQFRFGAEVTRIDHRSAERVVWIGRSGGIEQVVGDAILVAVGRVANVEGLGLDAAGVAFDEWGITVDDYLRTTNRRVFAAGDVCSRLHFTHLADFGARIVIQNALFASNFHLKYARASALVVPWCTYTRPELAHVGLTPRDAEQQGMAIDTVTVPLHDVDRAVLDGEDEGLLRVHLRRGTDRIVGATIVAEHAGDLISELTLAITSGIGLGRIGSTIHPYPTQGEVMRKAADAWRRTKLTPSAKRLLGRYFRIFS